MNEGEERMHIEFDILGNTQILEYSNLGILNLGKNTQFREEYSTFGILSIWNTLLLEYYILGILNFGNT